MLFRPAQRARGFSIKPHFISNGLFNVCRRLIFIVKAGLTCHSKFIFQTDTIFLALKIVIVTRHQGFTVPPSFPTLRSLVPVKHLIEINILFAVGLWQRFDFFTNEFGNCSFVGILF